MEINTDASSLVLSKSSCREIIRIEGLLAKRHFIKKMRNATHKHHLKGPRKGTVEDDEKFSEALEQLLDKDIAFQ